MPASVGSSSLASELRQIELVTKLIASSSVSGSSSGSGEASSGGSSVNGATGNLVNLKG